MKFINLPKTQKIYVLGVIFAVFVTVFAASLLGFQVNAKETDTVEAFDIVFLLDCSQSMNISI